MLESIDATVKPVVKLPMEKLVMLKSEQLIAESVIPMLFANMMVGDIYSDKSVSAKQVIAASMFKTMWRLLDDAVSLDKFL